MGGYQGAEVLPSASAIVVSLGYFVTIGIILAVLLVTSSVFTLRLVLAIFLRENPLDKIPGKVESFFMIARTARNRSVLCVE